MILDPQNSHRRKSSLVASEATAYRHRTKVTECYVHQLLEAQRKGALASSGGLGGIAELVSDSDKNPFEDTAGAQAGDGANDDNGQSDQAQWQKQLKQQMHNGGPGRDNMESQQAPGLHAVHSRLLTKKELSEMAWGVRELSKRLGSLRLKLNVKTVFLLTKAYDESLIANTRELARWLLSPERKVKYTVYVEETLKENKKFAAKDLMNDMEKAYTENGQVSGEWKDKRRLRYWTNEMCRTRPQTFDFVVTLGGDGTVLYSSWLFQRIVPPVLSFALGSLGFLTKFDYEEFEDTLTKAFRDGVTISLRLRFEGTVMRSQKRKLPITENGDVSDQDAYQGRDLVEELVGEENEDERTHRPDKTFEILNDIVVDRGPNPSELFPLLHADLELIFLSHVLYRNIRR